MIIMAAWLTWPAVYLVYLCIYVTTASQKEGFPTLKILVIGRTGSGKSTLINNLLGREIAKVGHRIYPQTTTVSAYQVEISGVDVTACDTPGLRDTSRKEEENMKKIKASCSDPDLVIFCLSMDNTRWHNDDEEAIQTVTEYLGDGIWKHSVLALTFADKVAMAVRHPEKEQETLRYFNERIADLEGLFHNTLLNYSVSNHEVPSAVSAKGHKDLPGVSLWLTELLVTCLSRTSENGAKALLQITMHRLRYPEDVNEDDFEKPEYEQPFIFTASLCNLIKL